MTTYTDFQPSTQQVFSFKPTLDGEVYNCTLTWNLFGQRYYINCSDLSNNLIFSLPLIGSPDGLIAEAVTWDTTGVVTVETIVPHGYRAGQTVNLTLAQTTPSDYSGNWNMLVINDNELTFLLASDPGLCTAPGLLYDNISIAAGYFDSTLVFRESSSQFEVTP